MSPDRRGRQIVPQCLAAEGDQDPALLPNGRVGDEGAVPGPAPDSEEMDYANPRLETGHDAIHDPVRRTARTVINRQLHRKTYNLSLRISGHSLRKMQRHSLMLVS